ncbi:MAG: hypothetical protein ACT4TC_23250, partial [Myxococcaceae bacterium]
SPRLRDNLREVARGVGLARPIVNAIGAAKNNLPLKRAGGVLGVVASVGAIDSFRAADGAGKVSASAVVGSTVAQVGSLAAKAGTLVSKLGKVGTPGLTSVSQGAAAVGEAKRGETFNAVTSGLVAAGAAVALIPGAQLIGAGIAASGVVLKALNWKTGNWLRDRIFGA